MFSFHKKNKTHILESSTRGLAMRTLRTLIMGGVMFIPGMFLGLVVWYIAGKPSTEPLETLICNGIPLVSISLGLFFGWATGEEYGIRVEK
jgi:hypothetical protein